MEDFKEHVMIALLPTHAEWCNIETPHMTLVYVGEKQKLKPSAFNELAKDAAAIAMLANPISLRVTGVEVFGGEGDPQVDVLRLQPTSELLSMRRSVEHWNASEHLFKPHATIGPMGEFIQEPPGALYFDRISVNWGDETLTFWLRK